MARRTFQHRKGAARRAGESGIDIERADARAFDPGEALRKGQRRPPGRALSRKQIEYLGVDDLGQLVDPGDACS
jgi:hypothetical protein